jgi:hypothetical protein
MFIESSSFNESFNELFKFELDEFDCKAVGKCLFNCGRSLTIYVRVDAPNLSSLSKKTC